MTRPTRFFDHASQEWCQNIGKDQNWRGTYLPATKEARAQVMRGRIEAHNAPPRWDFMPIQPEQGILL